MLKQLPIVSQIVGVRFKGSRIRAYNKCKPGDVVYLLRDHKNKFHRNAMKVVNSSGVQMGFLPRAIADWIVSRWAGWSRIEAVIVTRGPDYEECGWYCANIKLERFVK